MPRIIPTNDLLGKYRLLAAHPRLGRRYAALLASLRRWRVFVPGVVEAYLPRTVRVAAAGRDDSWLGTLRRLLGPRLRELRRVFEEGPLWDSVKARVVGLEVRGGEATVYVEPTTFFYSYITNLSPDLDHGGWSLRDAVEPLILSGDPAAPVKPLVEARRLPISNNLGINLLVVTRDGYLPLVLRSRRVATAPGKLGYTVAGSLDWETLEDAGGSARVEELALQELGEEDELGVPDISAYRLRPVALTRNLHLLGKPDILLAGATDCTLGEILHHAKLGRGELAGAVVVPLAEPGEVPRDPCQVIRLLSDRFARPLLTGRTVRGQLVGGGPFPVDAAKLSSSVLVALSAAAGHPCAAARPRGPLFTATRLSAAMSREELFEKLDKVLGDYFEAETIDQVRYYEHRKHNVSVNVAPEGAGVSIEVSGEICDYELAGEDVCDRQAAEARRAGFYLWKEDGMLFAGADKWFSLEATDEAVKWTVERVNALLRIVE